ncbi:MAG: hypothetical protein K6T30_06360 [Alicyclobacillus sp.]|nr:hypothetical protein [Alicyclobacillus sp.]
MQQLFTPLLGTRIRIEQHNDVGLTGWLVNVQSDYVSVYTEDRRIVHYPLVHIKSVTTNIAELPQPVDVPDVAFPASFRDLLTESWLQPVRIELGEGSRQGVLVQITDETICLVVNSKELVYYPITQIVNLSPIYDLHLARSEPADPDGRGHSSKSGDSGSGTSGSSGGDSAGGSDAQTGSRDPQSANGGNSESRDPRDARDRSDTREPRAGGAGGSGQSGAASSGPGSVWQAREPMARPDAGRVHSSASRLTLFNGGSQSRRANRTASGSGGKVHQASTASAPNSSPRRGPNVVVVRQTRSANSPWIQPKLRISPAGAASGVS